MGTSTLSGQESMMTDSGGWGSARFPSSRDAYVHDRTGRYPALYSSDFGDVYTSNLDQRQDVVDNAIAYAQQGSAIQLHYHMIQPDQPDGAGFDTMAGFDSSNPYPAANIDRILTPGDSLNVEHLGRLDTLAGYLRQLQDAGVAVLWRPYHEMNGGWFWWGQKDRFADLWIQQWDYLTNTHGLNNLLWVFSVNHWSDSGFGDLGPDAYYPGHDYVDVLGVDVYLEYGHSFDQYVHDTLLEVGGGRPIAFTENGEMPNIPTLSANQPNWVYWATWWGFEGADSGNTDTLYSTNYDDPRVITQDEVSVPSCP
jgi:mannan endo-1,4-beta-mannosidase